MSVPHPGDIYAGSAARVAELRALHPSLFRGPFISCSWPIGWHALVREACACAEALAPHIRWSQIKEKYGELKLYYSPMDAGADTGFGDTIKRLGCASLWTCALCGIRGNDEKNLPLAELILFDGWWLPACADCGSLIDAHRQSRGWGGDV